jgi:hypothetical protein
MKKKVTMMNKNTYLNEEHVVAFLDGELDVTGREVKTALAADKALAQAALEYHALSKSFARSASDPRFTLSAEADRKALAAIRTELAKKPLVDAPAARPSRTAVPMLKQMWFRRTSVGFAVALLLGALWFSFSKNDIKVEPTVASNEPAATTATAPEVKTTTPAVTDAPVTAPVTAPASHQVAVAQKPQVKNVTTTSSVKAPAAEKNFATKEQTTEETAAPADVMITRRYAKLVKTTPVIEITQQDKM